MIYVVREMLPFNIFFFEKSSRQMHRDFRVQKNLCGGIN
jgi:hypothetical protein